MSHDFDRAGKQRKQADRDKERLRIFRDDFKHALSDERVRRVLFTFMQTVGLDASPFNTNAMAMSQTVGQQDAARWWLNAIRDICPEREAQMRAEANRAAKQNRPEPEEQSDE